MQKLKDALFLLVLGAVVAVPVGGWFVYDHWHDARYQHRCVEHHSDIPLCDK